MINPNPKIFCAFRSLVAGPVAANSPGVLTPPCRLTISAASANLTLVIPRVADSPSGALPLRAPGRPFATPPAEREGPHGGNFFGVGLWLGAWLRGRGAQETEGAGKESYGSKIRQCSLGERRLPG